MKVGEFYSKEEWEVVHYIQKISAYEEPYGFFGLRSRDSHYVRVIILDKKSGFSMGFDEFDIKQYDNAKKVIWGKKK